MAHCCPITHPSEDVLPIFTHETRHTIWRERQHVIGIFLLLVLIYKCLGSVNITIVCRSGRKNLVFVHVADGNNIFRLHILDKNLVSSTISLSSIQGPKHFVQWADEIDIFLLTGGWKYIIQWADEICHITPVYLIPMSSLPRVCTRGSIFS